MPDITTSENRDLRVHSLASGSSGNACLVQYHGTNLLIDAGIGIRLLSSHLSRLGVSRDGLTAILLTHEHTDHSGSVVPASRKFNAPIVANSGTLSEVAGRSESTFLSHMLETGSGAQFGSLTVHSFPISHDAVDPVGFIISCDTGRICYATDIGCASEALRAAMQDAILIILESNHDEEWLWRGPYTAAMKERVAANTGHLSNRVCAELLAERAAAGPPFTAWLAHLSRVNNSPALARRTTLAGLSKVKEGAAVVEVALRDHPSVMWRAGRQAVQLALF